MHYCLEVVHTETYTYRETNISQSKEWADVDWFYGKTDQVWQHWEKGGKDELGKEERQIEKKKIEVIATEELSVVYIAY